MDIFDKAIIRIGRIISDNQKAFKAIDREEIPPYLDCDNEKDLQDSYGGVASPGSNSRMVASTLPRQMRALPIRVGITEN